MTTDDEERTALVRRISEDSVVLSGLRALTSESGSSGAFRSSTVGEVMTSWIEGSALYRWLTTEPEPEVIVIDLRETWTVGPVVAVLDWGVEFLASCWDGSRLSGVLEQCRNLAERVAETRGGQAMAALLLPPEPADDHRSADATGRNTGESDEREQVSERVGPDETVGTDSEHLDRR